MARSPYFHPLKRHSSSYFKKKKRENKKHWERGFT
jgi:hypothetical protein